MKKKKIIILSSFVFAFLFAVFNTTEANNATEDKTTERTEKLENRKIEIVGYIEGTWTEANNGGIHCPGSGYCCSIVGDGYQCWIMPYRSGKKGEKIEVTESQIEALRNGEVIYLD